MCRSVHVSGVESRDQREAAADCGFPQLMFGDYPRSSADNFTISTLSHHSPHSALMSHLWELFQGQNHAAQTLNLLHTDEHSKAGN